MADDDTKRDAERADGQAEEQAEGAREQRKERVLHTRVPAVLEEELKQLATNLKMPVSNVVRAILQDALEAVEVVGVRAEGEIKGFVDRLSEQREAIRRGAARAGRAASRGAKDASDAEVIEEADEAAEAGDGGDAARSAAPTFTCPPSDPSLDDVVGFQRLTLRADAECTVCGRPLPKGTEGCRGVRDEAGPRVLLGPRCGLLPVVD